jgi:hypothetical protein
VTYSTPVDRELWVAAVFTHDGKHVLGASASSKHRIHIWSNSGEPVAVLEGEGALGRGGADREGKASHGMPSSGGGEVGPWICPVLCGWPPGLVCADCAGHCCPVLSTRCCCRLVAGPKNDEVLALSWHPNRMLMVTVSSTGRVSTHVWCCVQHKDTYVHAFRRVVAPHQHHSQNSLLSEQQQISFFGSRTWSRCVCRRPLTRLR